MLPICVLEEIQAEIETIGQSSHYFNINAASPEKRSQVLDEIAEVLTERNCRSLAELREFWAQPEGIA